MAEEIPINFQKLEDLKHLFTEKILKIEDYLEKAVSNKKLNIKYQDTNSLIEIQDLGRN